MIKIANFCPECGGKNIADLKDKIICEKCGIQFRDESLREAYSFLKNFSNHELNLFKNEKENPKITAHSLKTTKTDKELAIIKEKIKKINWKKISDDWTIIVPINRFANKTILVDPYSDCSRANPLYMHKAWLEQIYYDEEFNLSMRNLAKICGIGKTSMHKWFQQHDIPIKEKTNDGLYFSKVDGKLKRYIPEGYFHPQLQPFKGKYGRALRFEHVLIMEKYLSGNPALIREKYGVSESCLLKGKYLDINCHVHHINNDPFDNDIENLWLYENGAEHGKAKKLLFKCFGSLVKLGQIRFNNGKYYLNNRFNYREDLNSSMIESILKPIEFDLHNIYWEGGWEYKRYKWVDGYIHIKISHAYGNPTVMNHKGEMLEHRYIAERILARNPEKNRKYLIDGKYLKSEYIVHHVNFDRSDNRVENLWVCESESEHKKIESSLYFLVKDLLTYGLIVFRNGKYYLNY